MEKSAELSKDETTEELLLQTLEQQRNFDGTPLCLYQGLWCPTFVFRPLLSLQKNFKPHDNSIVLASLPKAGTTLLKALLFSIVNRDRFPIDQSPLLTTNPHKLVLSLECSYFADHDNPDSGNLPQPGVFSTHLPLQVLSSSMIGSTSKIVYVSRNPLDQFISEREFLLKIRTVPDCEPLPLDQAFDMFCKGEHAFGPFWDHILGYWRASLENPDRVLFLQYEDMKRDSVSHVKKIAEFLGLPFSDEEEKRGLIREISDLCSFEKLKNLETNKTEIHHGNIANSSFFRKGEIGDWRNHLSPAMAERMKEVVDVKLSGSGLKLDTYIKP
ncbi:cytosolic sulfotransferase 15-like [Sesamum indicum]|uniref:Sulfotransferase n=1 Tax=Sesamum indicum TaxID=4182 RepID=A0A6I9TF50_SESIN|nr:cytosolic sulfotransferase 15-like [Sesamum indicum]